MIGVGLVGISFWIGVGHFHAQVQIHTTGSTITREIPLGYLEQWNYGFWFIIPLLCPAVFSLCSFVYQSSTRLTPPNWCKYCNLTQITNHILISVAGILICVFFLWKNVWVEVRDYNNLGLGWVQAEALEREWNLTNVSGSPVSIRRQFRTFNIEGEQIQAQQVDLLKIEPRSEERRVGKECRL